MPRDYKHRAQKKPTKKPVPGWLWLLTGLLIGAFLAGLFWLRGQSDEVGGAWVGEAPDRPPQRLQADSEPVVPPRPQPRFSFYETLPKQEVVIPDEELRQAAEVATVLPETIDYVIQLGSFRRNADADRLKAQLALLGFEAKVSKAVVPSQGTRYRVRTGPYRGMSALQDARRQLADNGHRGIVIRGASNP